MSCLCVTAFLPVVAVNLPDNENDSNLCRSEVSRIHLKDMWRSCGGSERPVLGGQPRIAADVPVYFTRCAVSGQNFLHFAVSFCYDARISGDAVFDGAVNNGTIPDVVSYFNNHILQRD